MVEGPRILLINSDVVSGARCQIYILQYSFLICSHMYVIKSQWPNCFIIVLILSRCRCLFSPFSFYNDKEDG